MKILRAVLMTAALTTATAFATPSTQIWIPSTDIQPYLKPHLGWDAYVGTSVKGGTLNPGTISNGGITIGVLPCKEVGLEVGIDYRDLTGDHNDPLYFNAKIGIPENTWSEFMPAIAVGGYDFGTKKNVSTYNLMYGLVAGNVGKLGRFSVGGFKGAVGADPKIMFANLKTGKVDDVGVLASWDRTLTEVSDKLWAAIDYQSGMNFYGALNFGVAWNFSSNAGVILGYDIYNAGDVLKPTVTLQIDANLF